MSIGRRIVCVLACVAVVVGLLMTQPWQARARATSNPEVIVFLCDTYGDIRVLYSSQSAGVPASFTMAAIGGPDANYPCAQYIADVQAAGFKNVSRFFNYANNGSFAYEYQK
jgi:hypothetical protein